MITKSKLCRLCKRCDKRFIPNTKFQRLCNHCWDINAHRPRANQAKGFSFANEIRKANTLKHKSLNTL